MIEKETVLTIINNRKKPASFKELTELLEVKKNDETQLKKMLRKMCKEGVIVRNKKFQYSPASEVNLVTGYFEAHKNGFGFVITAKPGERDIFIPQRKTMTAMNNDRVMARIERESTRDGSIVKILERANTFLVGTLEDSGAAFFLKPNNKMISIEVYIPKKDSKKAHHGDTVTVQITEFPESGRPPKGKVLKILKTPTEPNDEINYIIEEFNLPKRFPSRVINQAKTIDDKITPEKLENRKDCRNINTVTIDGEQARDFDDAVSIERIKQGYKLYVHIADVGYYVPMDCDIDLEARERGTSVYLPDRVIPMLPKQLSEDICSLKPKVDRLTFTVEMDFDLDGKDLGVSFYPSIINSNERMTYTDVFGILSEGKPKLLKKYAALIPDLELMGELCKILSKKRSKRGSLDFDLPEPEVLLNLQGNPENIIIAERNFAHTLIEEFMIAANEAVAEWLSSMDIPILYRIHEKPNKDKLENIAKILKCITDIKIKKLTPSGIAGVISKLSQNPLRDVIIYIILRSMKQAQYSPYNVGHFGLASEYYCHFTSPIRRYPDLVVHRILRDALNDGGINEKGKRELTKTLPLIAFNSSKMERMAERAEREAIAALRAWFMLDKVGEEFSGTIIGINANGIRIRLNDFYIEGFLHVSDMTDDFYIFHEECLTLTGRNKRRKFSVGGAITVRVDRVDTVGREIIFGIV
ncbi:MAG: ribonuclease R [Nitrospirae bacterium]|nr:ribonuclease R [Nitrospirota bacterium]